MQNYSVKEVSNICLRCLTKNDSNIKRFIEIFKYYECHNNIKKLEALTNIFNQCFIVEPRWEYDYSVDESKFVGYDVATSDFSEMVCIILDNQYKKIIKLKFIEENKNKELQDSINVLE